MERGGNREALDPIIEQLYAHLRAIELVSFAGASHAEAAEMLDISEATLHRDLKMARALLNNELRGIV
jgi:DNA-directed RNA polymerase specialized sigma24 family protein